MPLYRGHVEISSGQVYYGHTEVEAGYQQVAKFYENDPNITVTLNVIYNIKSSKIKKLTLGGCYIEKVNETVLISNEN